MKRIFLLVAIVVLQLSASTRSLAQNENWAGTFSNDKIKLIVVAGGSELMTGALTLGETTVYVVHGRFDGGKLVGSFSREGESEFSFEAMLDGDVLTLSTGKTKHVLQRKKAAPVNPLDELGGDQPPPPPAGGNEPTPAVGTEAPRPPDAAGPAAVDPARLAEALATLRKPAAPAPDAGREWTILVYMAADNDLEEFGIADLDEMEAGLPEKGVDVVVLVDRADGYDRSDGDWTGARLYHLQRDPERGRIVTHPVQDLGELDLGDPGTLAAFVVGGYATWPAKRLGLVMWDHGAGWSGMAVDENDAKGGRSLLDLGKMRAALDEGLDAIGRPRLDLVVFDMCHMAQLESATELEGRVDFIVGSENVAPGAGQPYDEMLPLFADAARSTKEIAAAIVAAYDDHYDRKNDRSTTIAALDLAVLDEVLKRLDGVVDLLLPDLDAAWTTAARALFFSESYSGRGDYRYGEKGLNSLDVLDMMKRIRFARKKDADAPAFDAFEAAIKRFVVATRNNEAHRLSNGVAIYGPVRSMSMSPRYAQTRFAQRCRWPQLLAAIHQRQDADRSEVKLEDLRILDANGRQIQQVQPLAGSEFKATIEGRNIVWTWILDGPVDAQSGDLIVYSKTILTDEAWYLKHEKAGVEAAHEADLEMIEYQDGGTAISTEYEGMQMILSNGEARSSGTIDVSNIDNGDSFTCDALLEHASLGAGPVEATLVFDRIWCQVVEIVTWQTDPNGAVMQRRLELESLPEDLVVTPIYEIVTRNGETSRARSKPLSWRKGLRLALELMKPGKYQGTLLVETMNGRQTRLDVPYEVVANTELEPLLGGWAGYKPEFLPGKWEIFVLGDGGKEVATGSTVEVAATNHPDYFSVTLTSGTEPKEVDQQLWQVDRMGLPNIRMVALQGDVPAGAMICPAVIGIKDGQPRLMTKMLALGGMLWVFHKTEGAVIDLGGDSGVADDAERFVPVETPDPRPLRN